MRHFRTSAFITPALSALVIAVGLTACSTNGLKPASEAQQVSDLENAARAEVEGVRMLVQDAEWPGETPIDEALTPLRVVVNNDSEQPLRIDYSNFMLVAPQGLISSALPLYEIEGTVEEPVAVRGSPAITEPGFAHTHFAVAPYLRHVYPSVRPSGLPFYYDRYYYGSHATQWESTELPTPEMRINALPEGVLEGGGHVEGWLYFRKIEDAERVVFRADLENAETGTGIGELRIPFEVE